jgi:hypothetical protein
MADRVIFPHLHGQNYPSYVLQVFMKLCNLGVPQENIRFLPDVCHFAEPEVFVEPMHEDPEPDSDRMSLRHPQGPMYDSRTRSIIVQEVNPEAVVPRLKVNIRSDRHFQYIYNDLGDEVGIRDEQRGRLENFMSPLITGLPPLEEEEQEKAESDWLPEERPLARIVRQVCARYPELMKGLDPEIADALQRMSDSLWKAFTEEDAARRAPFVQATLQALARQPDIIPVRDAFQLMVEKLPRQEIEGLPDDQIRGAMEEFQRMGGVLFIPDPTSRAQELGYLIASYGEKECDVLRALIREFQKRLSYENDIERARIVRELIEIMTTETFISVAVSDFLWGVGWVHGRISEFRTNPGRTDRDGYVLSQTGGMDHRTMLASIMARWADEGTFLGVGNPPAQEEYEEAGGRSRLAIGAMNEAEKRELWSLAAWRRDTPDPILLLETAARRLVHPEVTVDLTRWVCAPSRFETLFVQPGITAALGAQGWLHYPGIVIRVPIAEDEDEEAVQAKAKLEIIMRLFLPVCFRAEVVWQEAVARLDRPSYLQHDFQHGIRLVDPWAAMNEDGVEEANDPITL